MADVVERGDLYFLYRPKVQTAGETVSVEGLEDVERFFMVMHPQGKERYRLAILGRKRMPDTRDGHGRLWGFIDRVEDDASRVEQEFEAESYSTATRGRRERPVARPAGEGVYSIVRHEKHTHFTYVLELPKEPGEVQREFAIEEEASYIISVKNPEKPSPPGAGLTGKKKAELPKSKQRRFRGRRFIDLERPDMLDHAGTEFVLVGEHEDAEQRLGIVLKAQDEDAASAEIFRDLRTLRRQAPLAPLFKGEWK